MSKIFLPLQTKLRVVESLLILKNYNNFKLALADLDEFVCKPRLKNEEIEACRINLKQAIKEIDTLNFGLALSLIQNIISTIDGINVKLRCSQEWSDLVWTDDNSIRYCERCNKHVYQVNNSIDFLKRLQLGQCVAVNNDNPDKSLHSMKTKIKAVACILDIPEYEPLM